MNAVQQLLTDHIDIWTAAETEKKSGRGRASGSAGGVYGIKKLRELILELAVRGKLVPQDARDEPADELLKRIQNSRGKLLAEGKLKKNKLHSPITEKDKPFGVPNGWEWVRLGDVLEMLNGRAFKPTDWIVKGLPIVRIQNLNNTQAPFNYCDEKSVDDRHVINNDSFLISWSGTPGTSFGAFIWRGGKAALNQHIFSCFQIGQPYFDEFLELAINTRLEELIAKAHGGVGLQHVTKGKLEALTLVLPSISEQHRIIAKVDELMALCDQLEAQHVDAADAHQQLVSHLLGTLTQSQSAADFSTNWQRIAAHFDTLFTTEASIDALKQTLLQLAIMGKLVAQDANDEPASELLKRIDAEKAKLVSEGRIKKDKSPSTITEEEKPFILSEGWKWVRFNDVIDPSYPISYGVLVPGSDEKDGIPFVRIADLDIQSPPEKPEKSISREVDSEYERTRLEGGEILMGVVGSIGKLGVAPDTWKGANIARAICRIKVNEFITKRYIILLLQSQFMQRNFLGDTKTLAQPTLNIGLIRLSLTPLPPVPEQLRIVGKVDELMVLCDQVKSRITAANRQQKKLADVLVEHAVGG